MFSSVYVSKLTNLSSKSESLLMIIMNLKESTQFLREISQQQIFHIQEFGLWIKTEQARQWEEQMFLINNSGASPLLFRVNTLHTQLRIEYTIDTLLVKLFFLFKLCIIKDSIMWTLQPHK